MDFNKNFDDLHKDHFAPTIWKKEIPIRSTVEYISDRNGQSTSSKKFGNAYKHIFYIADHMQNQSSAFTGNFLKEKMGSAKHIDICLLRDAALGNVIGYGMLLEYATKFDTFRYAVSYADKDDAASNKIDEELKKMLDSAINR
ncbi:hypothetical protein [Pseudolactococcus insecticola]|uniref:Uncharacterized protein n=1 Tax=Pseudolactococcus insecticola TaxID=2709158 RepID=A0A6A0B975_9LACT|nr:hypothetical protein [Lactococcus insecticola]GFH41285.1 hypothetical protein Hs20B_16830 [Lactococcus insecticola]